ncbi:MAG: RluA family pseudouridine synthase [Bacteroidota bacterium]
MSSIGQLIIYKNKHLIALNKPATLPVQSDQSGDKALLDLAEIYCKSRLHLLHRLDRPTSGLVLFARNKAAMLAMNEQFQKGDIQKTYLAVVGQAPTPEEGLLEHYLIRDGRHKKARITDAQSEGSKLAQLRYQVNRQSERYTLLEIQLLTGRFHQIRAQLAAIGHPIKGDVKYGFRRSNRDRSIHLHAWKLQFKHPISQEIVSLKAPLPDDSLWNAFEIEN